MSSAPHAAIARFSIDRLLTPISADSPSGESLRYEGTWERINAARQQDDPNLEQGVWVTEVRKADWSLVEREALLALETRTKDLQIAVWLTEAWVHLYSFAGLRDGLLLLGALCENYWDTLHPGSEENDVEYRSSPLEWLDEKLTVEVRLLPVSAPQGGDLPQYSLSDWAMTHHLQTRSRSNPGAGGLSQLRLEQSLALTPTIWLMEAAQNVEDCLQAREQLFRILTARAGRQAVPFAYLRDTLEAVKGLLVSALSGRDLPATDMPLEAGEDGAELDASVEEVYSSLGPIRTRAEAYQRLAEAAEFLLRTEPHSPVPYLVRRAVSWGNMSLAELLPELSRNANEVAEISRLLQLEGEPGKDFR